MPVRLTGILGRLIYSGPMDVVSDAISAVRIGRPSSDRVRVGGRWCARFAPYDGAGFHVVLEGGCWLLAEGGSAPTAVRDPERAESREAKSFPLRVPK